MLALADRPFIVDTVQTELRRRGKALFHQLHPILGVSRDAEGRIAAIGEPGGRLEAFEVFFVEREDDAAEREALEASLERVLHDVILATDDYRAMLRRSVEVEEYLKDLAAEGVAGPLAVPQEELAEYAAFMEWLDDDNFVFLGYRAYQLVEVGGVPSLQVDAGSGLGLLRKLENSAYRDPVPLEQLPDDLRERVTGGRLFIVTKANAESTVHRARRMDYVGVKRLSESGQAVGELRFIGLFTTKALAAPVEEIPILRHKLRQVLELHQAIPGSHDHKAIVAAFNGMPREELFWSDAGQIHADIGTILRLEREQAVRLTLRADPLKRGVAVMVIMPKGRFSDAVRQKVQEHLTERLHARRVDSRLAIGEDEGHARFHFFFATDEQATPELARALEREVQQLARSWQDELRELLMERFGESEGAALATRYLDAFDDRFRADVTPARALVDVGHLERLDATSHVVDLIGPDAGAYGAAPGAA
jgi:glutamate dehydrogenase